MATISSTLRMIDSFSQPLSHMITGINKTIDALEDLQNKAAKPNEVSGAFIEARRSMSLAQHELDKMLSTQQQVTSEAKRTERGFFDLKDAAKSLGGILAGIFTVQLGGQGFNMFLQFEKGMREVFTLLPGISQEAMDGMTEQLKQFRIEYGIEAQAATRGLYQAISAGVPPQNVFEFMQIASKAATGGVTDLTTAVDGLSSVVNAYGVETISAGQVADLMFTAVRLGKTTFEEMSRSLHNVVPVASSLGLEFGNITAAMVTMTAQGVPTAQATTQMRQLLLELSKAGTETSDIFTKAAGVSFRDFIGQGNTVADALKIMEQVAAGTGKGINDLFSSVEAGSAALALTGPGMGRFANAIEEMKTSAGAGQEAFEIMSGSADFQLSQIRELIRVYMEDIGQAFVPVLKAISGLLNSGLLDPLLMAVMVFAASVGYVARLLGFVSNVLAPLSPLLWGLAAATMAYIAVKKLQAVTERGAIITTLKAIWANKAKAAANLLALGPIGLVIVAVAAFIGVLGALMTRFDFVRLGVIKAINGIIGAVNWLLEMIRKIPGVGKLLGDFRLGLLGEDAFRIRKKKDTFAFPGAENIVLPDLTLDTPAGLDVGKVGEVDKINKAVNIAEEDLRYLRDFAEREVLLSFERMTADARVTEEVLLSPRDAVLLRRTADKDFTQNFITVAPQVQVSNEISSKVDLEKEMAKMAARTQEEIEIGLAGLSVVLAR